MLAGCTPGLPFLLAETADVLPKKQVAVDLGAGGGGFRGGSNCCGGGTARLRIGVGGKQELGVDFHVVGSGPYLGGKLVWKIETARWLGVIFGAGAAGDKGGSFAGGGADLALVLSSRPFAGRLRIYGGARGGVLVPFHRDIYDGGGPTGWISLPVGLAIYASEPVQLFAEGAFLGAWAHNHLTADDQSQIARADFYGGYAALAIRIRLNGVQ